MREPSRLLYCTAHGQGLVTHLGGDRKIVWDRPVRYVPATAAATLLDQPHWLEAIPVAEIEDRWGVKPSTRMLRGEFQPSDDADLVDVVILDDATRAELLAAARGAKRPKAKKKTEPTTTDTTTGGDQ